MARIRFARIRGLIILNLEVGGINKNDSNFLPVALDTGASNTTIPPKVATALGYDLSDPKGEVEIITGGGIIAAKIIAVRKLTAVGETIENIDVSCHDLPENSLVDGVLGMNFLEHFDIDISFSTGTIELRPY